jgi:predicted glycogen debranching enzyme
MPPTRRPSSSSVGATKSAPRQSQAANPASATPAGEPFVAPTYSLDAAAPGGLDKLLNTEWLLTNGLGGFSMGTCAGVPARRYHALLIAAATPPVGRIVALNAMVETLDVIPDKGVPRAIELSTFRFCGHPPLLHPGGTARLKNFSQELTAKWVYEVREPGLAVEFVKEVQLLDRANAVQVRYTVRRLAGDGKQSLTLRMRPLTSLRDFHGLIRRAWADRFSVVAASSEAHVRFEGQPTQLHLRADRATFTTDGQWWNDFFYQSDAERGQDCVEDLFSPGAFTLNIPAAELSVACVVQASITPSAMIDGASDLRTRRDRLAAMQAAALSNRHAKTSPLAPADRETIAALVTGSDAFVVARRSPGGGTAGALDQTSIIAGYPWFADWGRDTSISLPGLLLSTGRLDDAKRTLLAFASHRKNGIVPNVFHDQTGEPEYNTADASLWFILGACAFRRAGGDRATWDGLLAPACLDIISHYRRGTDFNIAMDPQDKLITAGTNATQLTWMDAKRDGVTFTPRHGKAVEINALWHAALRELSIAVHDADSILAANLNDLAGVIATSFRAQFWNAKLGCLHDTLTPADGAAPAWIPQPDIRPNQLFAVSLPHSPLSIEQQRSVLTCVRERLLTPYGLRTLDPADPRFIGRYEGNLFERDRAYHNGTAWPWLLGPYAEALLRVGGFSEQSRKEARAALQPILAEMRGVPTRSGPCGCLGQIAEIYDGGSPQRPQGCPAQAWSIAEALRVMLMIA